MAVRMELSRIFIREMADLQFIELREADGERSFPIAIGLTEAAAIERRLKGQTPPRPQTHDLLASVISELGGTLERVIINSLSESTFYAKIIVSQGGREIEIDSRPSDAIAVAIGVGSPIFVDESVLESAGSEES